jgi:hypothetical protein
MCEESTPEDKATPFLIRVDFNLIPKRKQLLRLSKTAGSDEIRTGLTRYWPETFFTVRKCSR